MATAFVAAGQYEHWWFGIAWSGQAFVATSLGTDQEDAIRNVERCVPEGVETEPGNEDSDFFIAATRLLGELESGNEDNKRFLLAEDLLTGPMFRIFSAAACIPIGCVTTYGSVARTAGSEARAVGRAMAGNPLYPIVPCHRVVGADMALVGYGGRQDDKALRAKLGRLQAETRSIAGERAVMTPVGRLSVFPAEWAIRRALEDLADYESSQLELF